ncbi:MAG: undecaprenyl-diphosphate phosphatase [Elusimicrobiales bacterium]|nr:undecaprenyl-diphosphate phosphatase [Elusimicrobiales bacterium]
MDVWHAFFLGMLQGIGEFLPISSSAHLRLYSYLVGIEYQGLFFDVMLHLGTLFAVFIYFWKDILVLIKGFFSEDNESREFILSIIIATVPGVIFGLLLEDYAESVFRQVWLVAFSLIFFSFFIMFIDMKYGRNYCCEKKFNWRDGFWAGIFQSIAIIPGASRSGMSISGLLFLGYSRENAAKISFFMSMPIIFGAAVFEIKNAGGVSLDIPLVVGFLSSFIFGILSIKFLLSLLKKSSLKIFVIYRLLLGMLVLIKWFYER